MKNKTTALLLATIIPFVGITAEWQPETKQIIRTEKTPKMVISSGESTGGKEEAYSIKEI